MAATPHDAVTGALRAALSDGSNPVDGLLPLVYDDLRALAHRHLAGERADHTLNTTALVHEAYLKLADAAPAPHRGRTYFFGAAARAMRQILVDYARRRRRLKRGGGRRRSTLQEGHLVADEFAGELIDLDGALTQLAGVHPRQARVVECRFFGGLSVEDTAAVLDVSPRTVKQDWALAKAWLYRYLQSQMINR